MTRRKLTYAAGCLLPLVLVLLAAAYVTVWGQDHRERDCLRFVSSHVTTDKAAWNRLVCGVGR